MKNILFALPFLFLCFSLSAQTEKEDDIKVGLVLSGGGAKGFAHIGALKVIEESGLRIDYIGGTSMGAIIGALYASGYSAHQLDSIFNSVNFETLIQDQIPRSAKTFYEKADQERYALTLPFDDFKIKFPSAISKGQNVYNLLSKLLQHVSDVDDFNKLPIPFFCIATNVETGEPVLLDKGYLPEAISASGAFPSLFEPVDIDGKLLIDGGVVNNYPIDEVKAMGADIIVGVDVQAGLADRETLNSATSVLLQINNYRTVNAMKVKSKQTDIYIKPDIEDFTVISFADGKQIIDNGEKGARLKKEDLVALANKQKKPPRDPMQMIDNDSLLINRLTLSGNENYTRGYIKGKLRLKLNEKTTYEKFHQGINNLSATNNFRGIRYRLTPFENGQELSMNLQEKKNNTLLRLGVHYDDLYKSAALVNITQKNLLFGDDVASLDIVLGDNVRYNFEYYLDKGFYWSFGINSRFNSFDKDVDFELIEEDDINTGVEVNRINIDVSDFTNQVYIQTVVREEFAFGFGLEHKRYKIETSTIRNGNENLIFDRSDYGSVYSFLRLDTYDNKYFPKKGIYFDGDFHLYLFSSDFNDEFNEYSIGRAKIGFATSFFDRFALNLTTEGGFTLGNTNVTSFDFVLGGYGNEFINNFIPFLGYDFISFGGDSFVKATASLDYEFARKNHINFTANFANADNNIFENGEWFTTPDFTGYAIGYGLETFIGPVEIKYSWSPENRARWFFNVGFWF
ncbi:patatin [Leptobacterium flavescens]|uniref:Patatin n=1 Tax=Leptobacterium flavescens TaxID=472055 RepID=A0A6P0UVL7_9FLAO|nr:patatin-like phospholipase family protein [Leptobacterium flavescens]NER14456.1 patatin [Leptobacterium flavescens]